MFDSHLATWQAETAVPASERAWLAWIGRVEALLGHSADGDQRTDGYSMDGFYELWHANALHGAGGGPVVPGQVGLLRQFG